MPDWVAARERGQLLVRGPAIPRQALQQRAQRIEDPRRRQVREHAGYFAIRQPIVCPARSGTTVSPPQGYSAGTFHFVFSSFTFALLRGRP